MKLLAPVAVIVVAVEAIGIATDDRYCETAIRTIWIDCLNGHTLVAVEFQFTALVDEPVANRTFADLNALTDVLVTRCQTQRADRRRIKGHTPFHWWAIERHQKNA